MLPDADADLTYVYPDYPLSNVLACFGIILVLSIDQSTMLFLHQERNSGALGAPETAVKNDREVHPSGHEDITHAYDHDHHDHGHEHHENCGFMNCSNGDISNSVIIEMNTIDGTVEEKQRYDALALNDLSVKSILGTISVEILQATVTAYIMEFSIAIHSIIIGVNLGLLGEDSVSSIVALMIALGFHQAVEGFGLGAQLASSYCNGMGLTTGKVVLFAIFFCFSTPIGIVIGILTSSQSETDEQIAAKGAANAIATGTLLYVALVEMLRDLFDHHEPIQLGDTAGSIKSSNPRQTLVKIVGFSLGVAFMATLAVWA